VEVSFERRRRWLLGGSSRVASYLYCDGERRVGGAIVVRSVLDVLTPALTNLRQGVHWSAALHPEAREVRQADRSSDLE
jgi:hypothetical protein